MSQVVKIGQNNFQSNRGWNIPKITDLKVSWFLHYTTDFNLWFSLILVWEDIQFSKISSRSVIGLKDPRNSAAKSNLRNFKTMIGQSWKQDIRWKLCQEV